MTFGLLCFCLRGRTCVRDFMKRLRHAQHAVIRKSYEDFYLKGGARLKLQDGRHLYFPRAVILAIYGDAPAAMKCTLTGSACPVCFTPKTEFASVPDPSECLLRCPQTMGARRSTLRVMRNRAGRGWKQNAEQRARNIGVRLDLDNAWSPKSAIPHAWVFGPDARLDNVWQACPQVSLHGMDEGLTQKLNYGALCLGISEARRRDGASQTQVPCILLYML